MRTTQKRGERMIDVKKQRGVVLAMGVFMLTALLGIVGNGLMGHGFHAQYSISQYIGFATWSALLFGVGNVIMIATVARFLYSVGEAWEMPRGFYWLVVLMATGLVGVSVIPAGYFDDLGLGGVPTEIHTMCARLMFVTMIIIAAMLAVARPASKWTRRAFGLYVVYGVICALAYLTEAPWFMRGILMFEATFLLGFLFACAGMRGKQEHPVPSGLASGVREQIRGRQASKSNKVNSKSGKDKDGKRC